VSDNPVVKIRQLPADHSVTFSELNRDAVVVSITGTPRNYFVVEHVGARHFNPRSLEAIHDRTHVSITPFQAIVIFQEMTFDSREGIERTRLVICRSVNESDNRESRIPKAHLTEGNCEAIKFDDRVFVQPVDNFRSSPLRSGFRKSHETARMFLE